MTATQRLAIFSDLHANAAAAELFAADVATRQPDELVFLGDALTYGCQPRETLQILEELQRKYPVRFVLGNHDWYYLAGGDSEARKRLPSWIKESLSWTESRVSLTALRKFPWTEEYACGSVLFRHANLAAIGDWAYLRSTEDYARTSGQLVSRGSGALRCFCFGHTHRALLVTAHQDSIREDPDWGSFVSSEGDGDVMLVNPGSLGQPRSSQKLPSYMLLHIGAAQISAERVVLPFDWSDYRAAVSRSELSQSTKEKLLSFT